MAIEFKLPELGENIETGDLVRVIVSPGAQVHAGDPVIELETDKAVIEVPSTISGTVSEIKVKQVNSRGEVHEVSQKKAVLSRTLDLKYLFPGNPAARSFRGELKPLDQNWIMR